MFHCPHRRQKGVAWNWKGKGNQNTTKETEIKIRHMGLYLYLDPPTQQQHNTPTSVYHRCARFFQAGNKLRTFSQERWVNY